LMGDALLERMTRPSSHRSPTVLPPFSDCSPTVLRPFSDRSRTVFRLLSNSTTTIPVFEGGKAGFQLCRRQSCRPAGEAQMRTWLRGCIS
jgi:hypothetical protein